jgi:hypothetical protein
VNLALAILFMWLGCALLTVAFHQLGHIEDLVKDQSGQVLGPSTLVKSFKGQIGQNASAADIS